MLCDTIKWNIPIIVMFINEGYGDSDNDWQQEIVIWPPKPEVLISLEL